VLLRLQLDPRYLRTCPLAREGETVMRSAIIAGSIYLDYGEAQESTNRPRRARATCGSGFSLSAVLESRGGTIREMLCSWTANVPLRKTLTLLCPIKRPFRKLTRYRETLSALTMWFRHSQMHRSQARRIICPQV
jgi:hypothetical protein